MYKKYLITIQTRPTQIVKVIFLLKPRFLTFFLKIFDAQNQLPITFCLDLVCNKTLKAKVRHPHTQEFLTFNIPIAYKIRTKSYTKIVFNGR